MRRDTPRPSKRPTSTHNYLIVSDFHLSEGTHRHSGLTSEHEQFFYDDAFARMLVYHVNLSNDSISDRSWRKPWKLIFNGDLFSFVQVTSVPDQAPAFQKRYGLGTSENESIWKLNQIADGHPLFFATLGWFLSHPGYEITILKGNQDVELHWAGVRSALCDHIAREYGDWAGKMSLGHLPESPLPLEHRPQELPIAFRKRIQFQEWFDCQPPLYFAEHGHQYDPLTSFIDPLNPADPRKPTRLTQPQGRLWQRFLINPIKTRYRFAENLRPLPKYAAWLVADHPWDTVQTLLNRSEQVRAGWRMIRDSRGPKPDTLPTTHVKQLKDLNIELSRVQLLESLRRQVLTASSNRQDRLVHALRRDVMLKITVALALFVSLLTFLAGQWLVGFALALVALACIGFRARLTTEIRLTSSKQDLPKVGKHIGQILNKEFRGRTEPVQHLILGHSHTPSLEEIPADPDQAPPFRQWVVNTGSWIPVFHPDTDRTAAPQLTFLRLIPDRPDFHSSVPELLAWKPELNRPLPAILRQIPPT